jgi:hypothetical protein
MVSAILALCFGALGFIISIPCAWPVFSVASELKNMPVLLSVCGVALGLNAFYRERRLKARRKPVIVMSMAGLVLSDLAILIYFLCIFIKK